MTKPRRVLICAKGFPPLLGGVQTYSEQVARAWLAEGIEPVVVSSRPGERGWITLRYPEGAVRLWNVGTGSKAAVFLRLLAAARRILAREDFDACHATTWRAAAAVMPWRGRVPLVLTVHGREVLIVPRHLRVVLRRILRSADVVAAVSRPTLAAARGVLRDTAPDGAWLASHNGLSYAPEAQAFVRPPRTSATARIYSFCRLVERKNIAGGLRALRLLVDRGIDDFDYVIAGDGPERRALERLVLELGLADRVRLIGRIGEDEVVAGYRRADIFLHPQTAPRGADIEGFGLVIADAMSFGALAVAGRAGGPSDFIAHGRTGLLVDGDDVPAIADLLAAVLRDPARHDRIARDGQKWCIAHLSWREHVRDILRALPQKGRNQPRNPARIMSEDVDIST